MPVFSITPESSAEMWEGAAACAPGSQKCPGTMPALIPNPISASTRTNPTGTRCAAAAAPSSSKVALVEPPVHAANIPSNAMVLT